MVESARRDREQRLTIAATYLWQVNFLDAGFDRVTEIDTLWADSRQQAYSPSTLSRARQNFRSAATP
jgi:hypothetical protein